MTQALGREFNDLLLGSIDETLTSMLSGAVVDALYDYLQRVHYISRGEVPYQLDLLSTTLEKIFGASAQPMTNAIARKFYVKLGLEFNPNGTLLEYVNGAKMKLQNSASK